MERMSWSSKLLCIVFLGTLCTSCPAFAQDQEAARLEAERNAREAAALRASEERAREEARRERERVLREMSTDNRAVIEAANGGAERYREILARAEFDQIRAAFRAYQAARDELSIAVTSKTKLKDHARKIEKSANVFLDFIKRRNEKRQRFDPKEFKDFTTFELNWEALTTTERLVPQLAAVVRSQNASTVDVGFLLSLSKLEVELLRLKWMLGKLK